jgi:hypothetical protein
MSNLTGSRIARKRCARVPTLDKRGGWMRCLERGAGSIGTVGLYKDMSRLQGLSGGVDHGLQSVERHNHLIRELAFGNRPEQTTPSPQQCESADAGAW